MSSQHP